MKRIIKLIFLSLILTLNLDFNIVKATGSITTDVEKMNLAIGDKSYFNIVSDNSIGLIKVISSDETVASVKMLNSAGWIEENSLITCEVDGLNEGKCKIEVILADCATLDNEVLSKSCSIEVTVSKSVKTDNTISYISICDVLPVEEITDSVNTFTFYLPMDTVRSKISITPVSSSAKVTFSDTDLIPGWNITSFKVNTKNKGERTYTIKAYVEEKPDEIVEIEGIKYGVVKNTDTVKVKGFIRKDENLFHDNKVFVRYMMNMDNKEKKFFISNDDGSYLDFIPVTIEGKQYYALKIDENITDLVKSTVMIDDQTIECLQLNEEYRLINLLNNEGETDTYCYNIKDKFIQKYSPVNTKKNDNNITFALIIVFVVLIVSLILAKGNIKNLNEKIKNMENEIQKVNLENQQNIDKIKMLEKEKTDKKEIVDENNETVKKKQQTKHSSRKKQ